MHNFHFDLNLPIFSIHRIYAHHFDDCRRLLDGRLNQLSSFTVNIYYIEISSQFADNQVGFFWEIKYDLFTLKIFA